MMELTSDLFNRFQELIYGQSSLSFSPSRLINLEIRLRERVKVRGVVSYEDYFHLLLRDLEEFDNLLDSVTTKETYFFRLPGQFEALGRVILPALEELLSKESQKLMHEAGGPGAWKVPLRIWSAGCATGEEPYSIAMTLHNHLRYPRAWQTELLATDLSRKALAAAEMGFYEDAVIRKVPAHYLKKYFMTVSFGAVVREELLKSVAFRVFNLKSMERGLESCLMTGTGNVSEPMDLRGQFHVIFCRNVMIYFDFAAQQKLVDNLYAALKPGGYLFTGDAEHLHIYRHGFKTLEFEGTYYYRKPELDE